MLCTLQERRQNVGDSQRRPVRTEKTQNGIWYVHVYMYLHILVHVGDISDFTLSAAG